MILKPKKQYNTIKTAFISSFLAFLVLNITFTTFIYAANQFHGIAAHIQTGLMGSVQLPVSPVGITLSNVVRVSQKNMIVPKKTIKPVKKRQLAYNKPAVLVTVPQVINDTNTVISTLVGENVPTSEELYSLDNTMEDVESTALSTDDRSARLDKYFKKYNMPLSGYGQKFVEVADNCGIDWRLLPAISVQESTGGKYMRLNNPFGWASARIGFKDFNEAIEVVGGHLCGLNERTARYYKDKTSYEKLWSYNGTVNHSYPGRVLAIMNKF